MDRPIMMGGALGIETAPLRDIVKLLAGYPTAAPSGVEFMHIQNPEQKAGCSRDSKKAATARPSAWPKKSTSSSA